MTTDYAMMLSDLVKNVTITKKYKNFDMFYVDFPLEQSKNMKYNFSNLNSNKM